MKTEDRTNERFIELLDEYGAIPQVRARLAEVLESAAAGKVRGVAKSRARDEYAGLDGAGGMLALPLSEALRDAIALDALRCHRAPRDQAVIILEVAYGLEDPGLLKFVTPACRRSLLAEEIDRTLEELAALPPLDTDGKGGDLE